MKKNSSNQRLSLKARSQKGALLFGVIGLSGVVAALVFFMLSRQSESVKVIINEVHDAKNRRLLSDASMKLAANLQDNRQTFENAYDCDSTPSFKSLMDVGFSTEYKDVYFSCHVPTALGEFYLKLEKRNSSDSKSGSGIAVQGTKCRKTIFSFNVKGAGKVSFEYNPMLADPSDHKWNGGPVAQSACGATSTCYEWPAPATLPHTIVLRSTCSSSMTKAHLSNSNIVQLNTTFKDMPGLVWINLNYNSISSLASNVFQGLSVLEDLHLYGNNLGPELDSNILTGLSNLKALDLRNNRLKSFPPAQFATNVKLRNLALSSNKIGPNLTGTDLPPTLFSPLVDLYSLSLDLNELERLLPNTFSANAKLNDLNLNYNKLPNLESGVFNGLNDLQYLNLYGNLLGPQLLSDVFYPLPKLFSFDLRNNKLKSFPPAQFATNAKLRNLALSSNKIGPNLTGTDLPPTLFSPLVDLYSLSLDLNELERLLPNTFSANAKLNDLNLSYNELPNLESGVFNGLNDLQYLNLYGNLLGPQLLSDVFYPLPKLFSFDLRNNKLKSFPPDQFATNAKLRNLALSSNKIGPNLTGTDLPPTLFSPLVDLYSLSLDLNELERLLPNTFSANAKLNDLNLNYNELPNLESGVFNGLISLEILGLYSNLFTPDLLPNTFAPLVKLASLDLRMNQLKAPYLNLLLQELLLKNFLRNVGVGSQIPKAVPSLVDITALTSKGIGVSYDP